MRQLNSRFQPFNSNGAAAIIFSVYYIVWSSEVNGFNFFYTYASIDTCNTTIV